MGTDTSAELDAFDHRGERWLDEFEPEPHRAPSWQRVESPGPDDIQRWEPYVAPVRHRSIWPFVVVPVIVLAAFAGAAISWIDARPERVRASMLVPGPAAPGTGAPAAPAAVTPGTPTPPAPATAHQPAPPLTPAMVQPTTPTSAASAPAPAVTAPEAKAPSLDPAVEQTLAAFSRAYRTLDAGALAAVWPGADTAVLSESFSGLKYQALTFERCRTQRNGEDAVVATCDVEIASAAKSGDPALQRRHEVWTLALGRAGDRWTIAGLTVR